LIDYYSNGESMTFYACDSVYVSIADTLKDRKQELGILNPKKAYNICKY